MASKLNELDWQIVKAYADNNMTIYGAARQCYMNPNSIRNHLEKVKLHTGLDPRCFYDLAELMKTEKAK